MTGRVDSSILATSVSVVRKRRISPCHSIRDIRDSTTRFAENHTEHMSIFFELCEKKLTSSPSLTNPPQTPSSSNTSGPTARRRATRTKTGSGRKAWAV